MSVLGSFRVDGPPVPKARARTVLCADGKRRSYTPPRTVAYERLIGMSWRGPREFTGAVKVTVRVIEGRGKGRGDLDNYLKSVLDGLNRVAWRDDRQVVEISASIIRDDPRPALDVVVEGWERPQ